ncbi:DHH family phosphoesterase [Rummeliibacillus sp. POC4]|uniref:DHH family phosphoesterase n=1 Tax=Rummeliibacillus sp. POC4 TaxID=2305899 RepID=UPI000E668C91|nr:DHHA1 domain-containing protein [Rummeliibacillus sp. POC4]RIJ64985.1 DHH family phosphoesterase [Rummeliibacillus sp. POC4]
MDFKKLPKKLQNYENIHLITHTDLDGVGPSIVLRAFGITHSPYYVETRKVDEAVQTRLNELNDHELLIITDLSVNEETAEMIDKVNKKPDGRFVVLLDHHASAVSLNSYEWATVLPIVNDIKMSATTLIFKALKDAEYEISPIFHSTEEELEEIEKNTEYTTMEKETFFDRLAHLVEDIRLYDTWDWNVLSIQEATDLNTIFYARRRHDFIHARMDYLLNGQLFTAEDLAYLQFSKEELRKILKKKSKQMIIVPQYQLKGHDTPINIGVVETDSYYSELGNHLAEKFEEEIDAVFIISLVKNRVSLRSIGDKVNLSEIAKAYNGGGHPNASGCDLSELGAEFLLAVLEASKNR